MSLENSDIIVIMDLLEEVLSVEEIDISLILGT